MPLPKEKYYTVDEFYNLPDDIHAELINGQIVYMATPSETVNLTVYYVIFMPPFFVSLFSFSLVIALPALSACSLLVRLSWLRLQIRSQTARRSHPSHGKARTISLRCLPYIDTGFCVKHHHSGIQLCSL